MKIGIPRVLLFYRFYPMWKAFFESLGIEVVTSSITNKEIMDISVKESVSEACLPIKLAYGHIADLKNKVDIIYIPRIVGLEYQTYMCPKFIGLPDMIRARFTDIPPIIDHTIDKRNSQMGFLRGFFELGKVFTNNKTKILKAYLNGLNAIKEYEGQLKKGLLPIEILENKKLKSTDSILKIGIVGHCYEIYDEYISSGMIETLNKLGVKIFTMESLDWKEVLREANALPKRLFWTFGRELYGTAKYFIQRRLVDGIILTVAFGCGPDSLVRELIERDLVKPLNFPEITITVDEHSSDVGLLTRLEAFVDMLTRREKNENYLSPVW
jgi:predicted nucleotide-binding protein (sugar kinase/HSP70/actin superfamily)